MNLIKMIKDWVAIDFDLGCAIDMLRDINTPEKALCAVCDTPMKLHFVNTQIPEMNVYVTGFVYECNKCYFSSKMHFKVAKGTGEIKWAVIIQSPMDKQKFTKTHLCLGKDYGDKIKTKEGFQNVWVQVMEELTHIYKDKAKLPPYALTQLLSAKSNPLIPAIDLSRCYKCGKPFKNGEDIVFENKTGYPRHPTC